MIFNQFFVLEKSKILIGICPEPIQQTQWCSPSLPQNASWRSDPVMEPQVSLTHPMEHSRIRNPIGNPGHIDMVSEFNATVMYITHVTEFAPFHNY